MSIKTPEHIVEVRLKKIKSPKAGRAWRWDAEVYQIAESEYPGVNDRRFHMGGNFGYTRTRWGALRKIAKSFEEFEDFYVLR